MATEPTQRRLAAILSADAVGYSRLMGADDAATVATLKLHRHLLGTRVAAHGGRVVDEAGDGVLAEFPSATDAVLCAIEIQDELAAKNAELPPARRLPFRVGVHLGDVIVDGARIYGDGVNVAARLQAIAEPGRTVISAVVHEQLQAQLPGAFEDIGEQTLKNIARPLRAFRLREAASRPEDTEAPYRVPGFAGRPALAVLSFENLSDDPEQRYFADGLADELMTRLAQRRSHPLIARSSSFQYQGRNVDAKQLGRELGARYLVEGSVRRAGTRVRVTVRLIDATDGRQLLTDRHDGELRDAIELQDEIAGAIVSALDPAVMRAEGERALSRPPESLDAWERLARARWLRLRGFTKSEDMDEVEASYRRVIAIDPDCAEAHASLVWLQTLRLIHQWAPRPADTLREALAGAERAIRLDPAGPLGYAALGMARAIALELPAAVAALERGLSLDPSLMICRSGLGAVLVMLGRYDEGQAEAEKALRLSPRDPLAHMGYFAISLAHLLRDRFEEALAAADSGLALRPGVLALIRLRSVALGYLGRAEEAREAIAEMLRISPGIRVAGMRMPAAIVDRYLEGWRRAGWEETAP